VENRPDPLRYYGHPLLKAPVWTWEVPTYFFVGGAAGVAAVIAAVSTLAGGDPALARDARWLAAVGAVISPLLLVSDLGRPSRFANMLRVLKWRSAMSVGAWTLALFSAAVFASLALHLALAPDAPPAFRLAMSAADAIGALAGLVLATYTGVLLGATAIPVWSRHAAVLPIVFGMSALGSAVALLELSGHITPAMNFLGLVAAAVETAAAVWIHMHRDAATAHALHGGGTGRLVHAGDLGSGLLPLILRSAFAARTDVRLLVALSTIAGSLLTRFGWISAGRRSAMDPRAVV
jgi:formate-dependent nitrite reductase membrane component NrfD